MVKKTFKYCATHIEDEQYMQEMCHQGWAARKLTEGFWTFEPCKPDQYCYRICYLRGKTKEEVEALKKQYAAKGIQFVSRYSFWAIFRSTEEFQLYDGQEKLEICKKMYAPMPAGAVISLLLFCAGIWLSLVRSPLYWIPTVLIGLYGGICTWLAVSYRKLLKSLV